jgi:hypothetical protein
MIIWAGCPAPFVGPDASISALSFFSLFSLPVEKKKSQSRRRKVPFSNR